MTQFILSKKVTTNALLKNAYKLFIIIYSLYLSFSSQVFAMNAEAPLGAQSFAEIVFDDTAVLERRKQQIESALRQERIAKIESYYARYNLPLGQEAEHFVDAADQYDIDWRLVAAIGFIESTGGKFACQTADFSAFGWGSCKIDFNSYKESIYVISKNLGGHNPNTAYHYAEKDIRGILESYNPPSVVPDYADKVMRQMDIIAHQ